MKPSEIFTLLEAAEPTDRFLVTHGVENFNLHKDHTYEYVLEVMEHSASMTDLNLTVEIKKEIPEWDCEVYSYTIDKVSTTEQPYAKVPITGQSSISIPSLTTSSLNHLEAFGKLLAYVEEFDPHFDPTLGTNVEKCIPQINVASNLLDKSNWALRVVKNCGYLGQVQMSRQCALDLIEKLKEKKVNFGFDEETY